MNPLIPFYRAQAPDHAGRLITDIWSFSFDDLESHHDFIQWLFPLEVPSPVNPSAPTLDPPTLTTFRSSPDLQRRLLHSLDLMLHFYGLTRTASSPPTVSTADNFPDRSPNWLRRGNHNHHRLSRILRCLTLCDLKPQADALLTCLLEIAATNPLAVTPETLHFWKNAVKI